ncbi:hypothetical protein CGRA01v4_03007 [Colletotrichum graminicola]|nr:hypothetical protein CGRA01v4_03007 [Colletotrichum graminicola]
MVVVGSTIGGGGGGCPTTLESTSRIISEITRPGGGATEQSMLGLRWHGIARSRDCARPNATVTGIVQSCVNLSFNSEKDAAAAAATIYPSAVEANTHWKPLFPQPFTGVTSFQDT